jgi:hypothetical protein
MPMKGPRNENGFDDAVRLGRRLERETVLAYAREQAKKWASPDSIERLCDELAQGAHTVFVERGPWHDQGVSIGKWALGVEERLAAIERGLPAGGAP